MRTQASHAGLPPGPLDNRMQRIIELLEVREPLYIETADYIINTEENSIKQVVKHIRERISANA